MSSDILGFLNWRRRGLIFASFFIFPAFSVDLLRKITLFLLSHSAINSQTCSYNIIPSLAFPFSYFFVLESD